MGPAWGPPGSCRPQMGPMLVPWTLLSGLSPSLCPRMSPATSICSVFPHLVYIHLYHVASAYKLIRHGATTIEIFISEALGNDNCNYSTVVSQNFRPWAWWLHFKKTLNILEFFIICVIRPQTVNTHPSCKPAIVQLYLLQFLNRYYAISLSELPNSYSVWSSVLNRFRLLSSDWRLASMVVDLKVFRNAFRDENCCILILNSLKFVSKCRIDKIHQCFRSNCLASNRLQVIMRTVSFHWR